MFKKATFFLSSSLPNATLNVISLLNVGSNIIYASGSNATFPSNRNVAASSMLGTQNVMSASLNGNNAQIQSTHLVGFNLNVLGTNLIQTSSVNDFGSVFVGRNNAIDGNRNKTAETVFAVGTGDSTTRKTGFLIDSGSNTFIEGTLNVSGSTSLTGSLTITGSGTINGSPIVVSNQTGSNVISIAPYTLPLTFDCQLGNNTGVRVSLNAPTEFTGSATGSFTGSVQITSGSQLTLPTGSNQQAGTAVLDGANPGTVTVSNSLVTANSIIMLTKQTNNHPNAGPVVVSSKGAGTFTITSNHNGDADTVGWFIINNS
jgi:hypothetical protein